MDQRPLSMPLVHWAMANACRKDDVALMSQCFSAAQRADSRVTLQEALQAGLRKSVKEAAMACISYVLDQGADIAKLDPCWLIGENSTYTSIRVVLELLVARGFDINSQKSCLPVLWEVGVADHELVEWCLDHGADLDPPDPTPKNSVSERKPILESAAVVSNIATFELLRSRGAPLDRNFGVFPVAVIAANDGTCGNDNSFEKKMNMLKHLLEVVGCNVNSLTYGSHYESGSTCSTPLCWIACHPRGEIAKVRRLIWFLLDHGGDVHFNPFPHSPSEATVMNSAHESAKKCWATGKPNQVFLDAVRDWETQRETDALKQN